LSALLSIFLATFQQAMGQTESVVTGIVLPVEIVLHIFQFAPWHCLFVSRAARQACEQSLQKECEGVRCDSPVWQVMVEGTFAKGGRA
jgi:hypothetical protein